MSAVLAALLLEVKPLALLASWEPVGARLEALTQAARGLGSMTERDTILLRSWGRRWARLTPEVRAFYARHVQAEDSETARVVLWKILEGKRAEPWMVRKLERLWEQDSGVQPIGIDLAPLVR